MHRAVDGWFGYAYMTADRSLLDNLEQGSGKVFNPDGDLVATGNHVNNQFKLDKARDSKAVWSLVLLKTWTCGTSGWVTWVPTAFENRRMV